MSLSTLCETCQQTLCLDLLEASDSAEERCGPHHVTQKTFMDAISSKCVICNVAKKIIKRRGWSLSNSPGTDWDPWFYEYRPIWNNFNIYYGVPHGSEVLTFNLCPRDVQSAKCLDAASTYAYGEPGASSASALQLALHWIENCCDRHPVCRKLQDKEAWWPTRLIDIGDEGKGVWKIVSLPRNLQSPPTYITLSYRWGNAVKVRLLKENLRSFQDGLPIMTLPRTFQDAISVARKFSVRFLWIDALCIVQNCSEDWDRESRTMRRVHSNALCNLAAVASGDPDGGLFRTRNVEDLQPSLVRTGLNKAAPLKEYYAIDLGYMKRQILDSELMKRGWVFQERLLCPRLLYFAEEQVFWECFVDQRCETYPDGIPGSISSKTIDLSIITDPVDRRSGPEQGLEVTRRWQGLIERYTECKLTKASDKLLAMEGIADLFRNIFHDKYFYGLWKTNLVQQLGYFVQSLSSNSSSGWVAPSWTWASLQSPVKYPPFRVHTTDYVSILNLDTLEGVLRLRGHLIHTEINEISRKFPLIHFMASGSRTHGQIYPDRRSVRDNMPKHVTIMPLRSYEGIASQLRPTLDCLVLEPILVVNASSYRRIAYVTMYQGQDLALFGITVLADGSGTMEAGTLSDINLM